MKLLLDTHALLWFIGNDPQLSPPGTKEVTKQLARWSGQLSRS
jgi:PIN domain nuclease of toxin-antitoxin system